jgi:hypothetical protein
MEVSRRSWIIGGEQHGRSWRLVEGHESLGKVMEPCGTWWRIKEASSITFSSVLSKVFPLISSLF